MKILINALPITNLSGRHVLLGHLSHVAPMAIGKHEFIVLFHKANKDICRDLGPNVRWVECPAYTAGWTGRIWYEKRSLSKFVRDVSADAFLNMSGTFTRGLPVPQMSYAMNPWALVTEIPKALMEEGKAFLQRCAYRSATRHADLMVFLSGYMKKIYRENAGCNEKASAVVYTGIDEEIFDKARLFNIEQDKKDFSVLCVSVMAPHKDIETVVRAIERVRSFYKVPVTLDLAGPWADANYRSVIGKLIHDLKLDEVVSIKNHLSRDDLHDAYRKAKVFSLMSRCESFGIPSIEAQAFGTPSVCSNCCAMPEVCGKAGLYPEPGDVDNCSKMIADLFLDESLWRRYSEAAIENAERFRWKNCSLQFLEAIDFLAV